MMSNVKKLNAEVKMVLETITPEMAAKFLAKNINNRNLNSGTVKYYKDMIERDRWLVNGESIKIAEDGSLLDGQHRLEAIRQANKHVKMFVIYNVDNYAFMTIDAGRPRRHSDYLKVHGKSGDLNKIAAAARIAMAFKKSGEFVPFSGKLSPDILIWYVDIHPGLEHAVAEISGKMNNIISGSISSGLKYIFSVVDDVAAETFFNSLISGANLPQKSPVLSLRTRLLNLRGGGGMTWQREVVHCFVAAFNAYKSGKDITYLKYLPGQKTILEGFSGQLMDSAFISLMFGMTRWSKPASSSTMPQKQNGFRKC